MVKLDNATRWNSQYNAIERALQLKERVILYQNRYDDIPESDFLTKQDWKELDEIYTALKPFQQATDIVQGRAGNGRYGSIWEWLVVVEALHGYLEKVVQSYIAKKEEEHHLCRAHQYAWEKLNKWYRRSDLSHTIYAAATLLVPHCRMDYFNRNWSATKQIKNTMLKKVKAEWTANYKQEGVQLPTKQPSIFDVQMGHLDIEEGDDPFARYVNAPPTDLPTESDYHILDWWDNNGPPALRQMAYDLISIPATSCECERVFSGTKHLVTPQTARLTDKTIEQRECLRQWIKSGLIELQIL